MSREKPAINLLISVSYQHTISAIIVDRRKFDNTVWFLSSVY